MLRKKKQKAKRPCRLEKPGPIPFKIFLDLAALKKRVIPEETYLHRIQFWESTSKKELKQGEGLKDAREINAEIKKANQEETEGRLIIEALELSARKIETLCCRITDQILMAEEKRHDLSKLFSASKWNLKYIELMNRLWPSMNPILQKKLIERLDTK